MRERPLGVVPATIGRRTIIKTGAAVLGAAAAGVLAAPYVARAQAEGPIKVPALPYADDALAPVISSNTIGFHYGKHHIGYATALNAALAGPAKDYAALSLEDIIKTSRANPNRAGVFNAAAQVWNHTFYWNSMKPGGGGEPPAGKLKDAIAKALVDSVHEPSFPAPGLIPTLSAQSRFRSVLWYG